MQIRKIKKSDIGTLEVGWAPLNAEDVVDAGVTLAEDEVLVYFSETQEAEEEEDTTNAGGDSVAVIKGLKQKIHRLNQESASRRIEINSLRTAKKGLEAELGGYKEKLSAREQLDKKEKAKELFKEYVAEKKHVFVSPEAGEDIQAEVLNQLDPAVEITKENLAAAYDKLITRKAYALKKVELPSTQGGKQVPAENTEASGDVVLDETLLNEVAAAFNLNHTSKKENK